MPTCSGPRTDLACPLPLQSSSIPGARSPQTHCAAGPAGPGAGSDRQAGWWAGGGSARPGPAPWGSSLHGTVATSSQPPTHYLTTKDPCDCVLHLCRVAPTAAPPPAPNCRDHHPPASSGCSGDTQMAEACMRPAPTVNPERPGWGGSVLGRPGRQG